MSTEFGPCEDWPVKWPCDVSCESDAATGTAVAFATEVIWALSGQQFGYCDVTFRPCRDDCHDAPWPTSEVGPWPGTSFVTPALIGGLWYNLPGCGSCGGFCSCSALSEVTLPAPTSSILEVKVDGQVLPASGYRLYDHRKLVRVNAAWPRCNDLELGDDQVGTWSITARVGRAVPEGGQWAVGELACELLKSLKGEDCRLPQNVTQLARQGVTITYPDVTQLFDKGHTGLYLTDLFIATWNPARLRQRARVYSVDHPKRRRETT